MNKTEIGDQSQEKSQEEKDLVDAEAYKSVRKDMFRFKDEAKELRAKLAQLEADKDSEESQKLIEGKRYKEAFEKEKAAREAANKELQAERESLQRDRKLTALKAAISFKKPEYAEKFIDLNEVQFDGSNNIDPASVKAVADRFRQDYPELIDSMSTSNKSRGLSSTPPRSTESGMSGGEEAMTFEKFMKMDTAERRKATHKYVKAKNYPRPKWTDPVE